jgi:hypothetical protein
VAVADAAQPDSDSTSAVIKGRKGNRRFALLNLRNDTFTSLHDQIQQSRSEVVTDVALQLVRA